jgi:hypothetical protein
MAVLIVIAVASLLLSGSDGSVPPVEDPTAPTSTTAPGQLEEPGSVTTFGIEHGLPSTHAWNVAATANGHVWASVVRGGSVGSTARNCSWAMVEFDGSRWSSLELAGDGSTPPQTTEYCLTTPFRGATSDGTLWFVGNREDGGLWSWRAGVWTTHDAVTPNPDAPMWIGDDTVWLPIVGGLAEYTDGSWTTFDLGNTNLAETLRGKVFAGGYVAADWFLEEAHCMSGGVDASGTLWLTGRADALAEFDGKSWSIGEDAGEDWASWCISDVGPAAFGPDGAIWYASERGLIRWLGAERTEWSISESTPVRTLEYGQILEVTPDGRVWIPSYGQLRVFDPSSESWSVAHGVQHGELTNAAVDTDGAVWLAGPSGIARYVPVSNEISDERSEP